MVDILPALKVRGFQSIQTTKAEWIPGALTQRVNAASLTEVLRLSPRPLH